MRILIIEDEKHTADYLIELLNNFDSSFKICEILGTVKKSLNWFKVNDPPDLIFQDIVLSDGDCFEIFDKIKIESPVIFTTAYSEYAIKSFRVNSIDYLLKPYDAEDINRVLKKFFRFKDIFRQPDLQLLKEIVQATSKSIKRRILVKSGDRFYPINVNEVTCFYYDEGVTMAVMKNHKKYIVDDTILELANQLDSDNFFQINRKYIVNIGAIVKISKWFNSRLKVEIGAELKEEIIVSRERVTDFKNWLNK
jgi:two-component system, LytTR family, response regulator LytT